MSIDSIIIHDTDERHAPPSQPVLRVSIVDTVVCLDIYHYDEDHTSVSMERVAGTSVQTADLVSAIQWLGAADQAERERKRGGQDGSPRNEQA